MAQKTLQIIYKEKMNSCNQPDVRLLNEAAVSVDRQQPNHPSQCARLKETIVRRRWVHRPLCWESSDSLAGRHLNLITPELTSQRARL